jgi:hypothetical protein
VTELTNDPKLVNAAINEALKEEPVKVKTLAPTNNHVDLPGGYISPGGLLAKYAEVKELTGVDEEAIAKSGSLGRALNTILQKGLVSIGGEPVTRDAFDDLLSADRDAIMIGIRNVTFGETIEYTAVCQSCNTTQDLKIDLTKDVPVKELNNPIEDRNWTIEVKAGLVNVTLPTGDIQRKLMENMDKTSAEMNTMLLSGCVLSVNGASSIGASTVLKLGMGDREKLVDEILEKNPGPRLGEVKKACEACGESIPTPLSLMSLFRL